MTDFHLFPKLPPELRRMIWKECLPMNRVFGIIWPVDYAGPSPNRCRNPFWSSVMNKIPPIITRVCHESRTVALEVGRFVHDIGDVPLPRAIWAIPKTGITIDYCFLTSSWLLGKGGGEDPTVRAIIVDQSTAQHFNDFGGWAKVYREKPPDVHLPKTIFICRWIIFLHVSQEDMVESQLFGRLGEEVIQLVDPMDSETLNQFKTLALTSSPQLAYTRDFFKLMDTPLFKDELAEDIEQTRQCFFWHTWLAAHATRFRGVPDPEDIWIGPRTRDGLPLDMLSPGTYCDSVVDLSDKEEQEDYVPNVKHPWVKEVLEMMPNFGLRVMFRPCPYECWAPSTPTTPHTTGNTGSITPSSTGSF